MRAPVIAVMVLSLLLVAAPALAWSNGTGGYNSYGTHDWVLDHVLDALGHRADWVCVRAALRATDDPDSKDGLDHASGTWWHVYDIWGDEYGDAPEAVEVWFSRAKQRLDRGKECAASRALGIMAHLLADVAQPMHTDSRPAEERVHGPYESAVDSRSEVGDDVYSSSFDGVDPAAPYRRTVRVAKQAHRPLLGPRPELRPGRLQRSRREDHAEAVEPIDERCGRCCRLDVVDGRTGSAWSGPSGDRLSHHAERVQYKSHQRERPRNRNVTAFARLASARLASAP